MGFNMRIGTGLVMAGALCAAPVGAQDAPVERPAPTTLGALITRAARELGVTICYDPRLDREEVVVAGAAAATAREVAIQALRLEGFELVVETATRTAHVRRGVPPDHGDTTAVVEATHRRAHELASAVRDLTPPTPTAPWVRVHATPDGRAVVLAGPARSVALARDLVAALDRPQAAAPREPGPETIVLRLRHADANSVARMLGVLHLKVIPDAASQTLVASGTAADIQVARRLVTELDVERPAPAGK